MPEKMCACGKPLHYNDPQIQELMEGHVAKLGECVEIKVLGSGRRFMVPRHYVALHGVRGADIPALAERCGFEEVK
jgi:hypothetical protein